MSAPHNYASSSARQACRAAANALHRRAAPELGACQARRRCGRRRPPLSALTGCSGRRLQRRPALLGGRLQPRPLAGTLQRAIRSFRRRAARNAPRSHRSRLAGLHDPPAPRAHRAGLFSSRHGVQLSREPLSPAYLGSRSGRARPARGYRPQPPPAPTACRRRLPRRRPQPPSPCSPLASHFCQLNQTTHIQPRRTHASAPPPLLPPSSYAAVCSAAAASASRCATPPSTGSSRVTSLKMELRDTSTKPSLAIRCREGALASPTFARNLVTPWERRRGRQERRWVWGWLGATR